MKFLCCKGLWEGTYQFGDLFSRVFNKLTSLFDAEILSYAELIFFFWFLLVLLTIFSLLHAVRSRVGQERDVDVSCGAFLEENFKAL